MGVKLVPICDNCGMNFSVSLEFLMDWKEDSCTSLCQYKFYPPTCPNCGEPIDYIQMPSNPPNPHKFTLTADGEFVDLVK